MILNILQFLNLTWEREKIQMFLLSLFKITIKREQKSISTHVQMKKHVISKNKKKMLKRFNQRR